jgi:hypothetical protein
MMVTGHLQISILQYSHNSFIIFRESVMYECVGEMTDEIPTKTNVVTLQIHK